MSHRLAVLALGLERGHAAVRHAERAVRVLEGFGDVDPFREGHRNSVLGSAYLKIEQPKRAVEAYRRAARAFERSGRKESAAVNQYMLGHSQALAFDPTEGIRTIQAALPPLRGNTFSEPDAFLQLAEVAYLARDWKLMRASALRAEELTPEYEPEWRYWYLALDRMLALTEVRAGDLQAGLSRLDRHLRRARQSGDTNLEQRSQQARVEAYLLAGAARTAQQLVGTVFAVVPAAEVAPHLRLPWEGLRARSALASGDPEAGLYYAQHLETLRARTDAPGELAEATLGLAQAVLEADPRRACALRAEGIELLERAGPGWRRELRGRLARTADCDTRS